MTKSLRSIASIALLLFAPATARCASVTPSFDTVEHRAFDFFWSESDPNTGLTKDRAVNTVGQVDTHTIASIAATGYALTALPIAVKRHWISDKLAYSRALATLRYAKDTLPQEHGFYYHFSDMRSGERVWKSEVSSIDTALFVMGALVAGEYWHGTEVERDAHAIADRVDWRWMQDGGPKSPGEISISMGWRPEAGWIDNRWRGYSEACFMYLLALGSGGASVAPATWDAWHFDTVYVGGHEVFDGATPMFMAQMTAGYFHLAGLQDRQGRDWWKAWTNANALDQDYCASQRKNKTYAAGFCGINANDQPPPVGYGAAQPEDGQNDGTVSPSAMIASIMFDRTEAEGSLARLSTLQDKIWGKYGYANAFNLDKNWFDTDVLGLDLGMEMIAIENARSGFVWQLVADTAESKRGLAAAGFAVPIGK